MASLEEVAKEEMAELGMTGELDTTTSMRVPSSITCLGLRKSVTDTTVRRTV